MTICDKCKYSRFKFSLRHAMMLCMRYKLDERTNPVTGLTEPILPPQLYWLEGKTVGTHRKFWYASCFDVNKTGRCIMFQKQTLWDKIVKGLGY